MLLLNLTKFQQRTGNDERFTQWVNNAVGMMIESKGKGRVAVRVASHSYCPPNKMLPGMYWVGVCLSNADGSSAIEGAYYARFGSEWFSLRSNGRGRHL